MTLLSDVLTPILPAYGDVRVSLFRRAAGIGHP
jgi:hypothetical protein